MFGSWLNPRLVERLSAVNEFIRSNETVTVGSSDIRHDWWLRATVRREVQDYDETFSPIRMESLRMIIGLAARHSLKLHQLDVSTAFLNGEEVYMEQLESFVAEGQERLVCKLKRSIYGLKQSPRCWNATLDAYLKTIGFLQSTSDPCVYISAFGEMAVIGVNVDDFVVACKSADRLKQVKQDICRRFVVKGLGN